MRKQPDEHIDWGDRTVMKTLFGRFGNTGVSMLWDGGRYSARGAGGDGHRVWYSPQGSLIRMFVLFLINAPGKIKLPGVSFRACKSWRNNSCRDCKSCFSVVSLQNENK